LYKYTITKKQCHNYDTVFCFNIKIIPSYILSFLKIIAEIIIGETPPIAKIIPNNDCKYMLAIKANTIVNGYIVTKYD